MAPVGGLRGASRWTAWRQSVDCVAPVGGLRDASRWTAWRQSVDCVVVGGYAIKYPEGSTH